MQTAEQTLLDLKYLLMEAKQKCVPLLALLSISTRSRSLARGGGQEADAPDVRCPTPCRVPPFLLSIEDPNLGADGKPVGCTNCGGASPLPLPSTSLKRPARLTLDSPSARACVGLGHTIRNCPKLEENQRRTMAGFGRGGEGGY